MTTHMIHSFSAHNSNLSEMVHTQGKKLLVRVVQILTFLLGSNFFCWTFSCASMLRCSCSVLIQQLFEAGKIDKDKKSKCLLYIRQESVHEEIRNLISLILLPKKMHKNDDSQAAYLRAAVSRVSVALKSFLQLHSTLDSQSYNTRRPRCTDATPNLWTHL